MMNRRVMFIMSLAVLSTALIILSCTGHKFVTKKLYVSERLIIPTGPETSVLKLDGDTDKLSWDSDEILVWDAPVGDRVLAALPLPRGERFEDYGLCKFDLKIEGGPVDIMVFVEKPGEKRRLYRPVDINEPPPGWRTIHIDLKQPEIVRESHFPADEPRIAFNLWAMNTGYPDQEPTRMIAIRNVRLCKRRLDVRWDGVNYRVVPDKSGDLVYEYPVTVYNKDNENLRIAPRIETSVRHYGTASFTPGETALAPGDSTVFTAVLRLPSEYVKEFPVLYCEWFMPLFSIVGMPDSDEGILRSSDLISLPLIIMPELESPVAVFDREGLRLMRERYHTTSWGRAEGERIIAQAEQILKGDLTVPDGPGWARAYYYCHEHRCTLQYQGQDKHYCPVGKEYRTVDFMGVDLDRDYRAGEHNAITAKTYRLALAFALTGDNRFSRGALNIINQYREKYFTFDWLDLDASTETIDKGRFHFAKYMESYGFRYMIEALDILKGTGGVAPEEARTIEQQLFLPALAEMTDYRMDMLCRQSTITYTALMGGFACGHAPLTAFATLSPYGYFSLRRWGATADGICHGHGYAQLSYARNQVDMAEMLYRIAGIDTFDHELKRIIDGSYWWCVPMNQKRMSDIFTIAARHYTDPIYRKHTRRSLIEGEPPRFDDGVVDIGTPPSVNFPNSGLTMLRRPFDGSTLDAEFKWGIPDNRGSFSVLSLGLYWYGYKCQSYPGHFNWGSTDLHHNWQIQSASHSTIIVDRHNQSGMKDYIKGHYMPHASEQLYYDDGPDAAVTVTYNDRIYPGVKLWRAVLVLDGAFLVVDALRSETEHTYDRWFHGVPDHTNGREGISLDLNPRTDPLGDEDGYQMLYKLSSAETNENFAADWKLPDAGQKPFTFSMRVLNEAPVEVIHGFEWSRQYQSPEKEFLLLRRKNANNADYIVLYEPHKGESKLTHFERFAVKNESGRSAEMAVGLTITLGGKQYEIILNLDGEKVQTVKGITEKIISVKIQ